jgi:hypothetical protein
MSVWRGDRRLLPALERSRFDDGATLEHAILAFESENSQIH